MCWVCSDAGLSGSAAGDCPDQLAALAKGKQGQVGAKLDREELAGPTSSIGISKFVATRMQREESQSVWRRDGDAT